MQHFTPPKVGKLLKPKMLALIASGIFLVVLLATSVFIVDQTERAVITRFGRYLETRMPGLQFRLPFGIDRSHIVNVTTIQAQEFGFRTVRGANVPGRAATQTLVALPAESTMLTGDLNIVDVNWTIHYRVVDARAWTFNVNDRIPTIRDVSRSVMNQLVGDRAIMDIMGVERYAIEAESIVMMNEIYQSYGLGIHVVTVNLQRVMPPPGVQPAFDDVNMAIQDRERLINEGQQAFNEQIPRTRGEAERMILVAYGYAAERVNRALGNVARFNSVLAEYQLAPAVTRQRLYFEMMEDVFGNKEGTTLVDHNLQNFLPLMNLGGQ